MNLVGAEKDRPGAWAGESGAVPFTKVRDNMQIWLQTLCADLNAREFLEWISKFQSRKVTEADIQSYQTSMTGYDLSRMNKVWGTTIMKCTSGAARRKVTLESTNDGINMWRGLDKHWRSRNIGSRKLMHKRITCLLYTSPSPRDRTRSRMPSSA